MSRAVYEVLPKGKGWLVRMASDSESETHATKDVAIRRARQLAQRYNEWRVRILSESGELEVEYMSPEAAP